MATEALKSTAITNLDATPVVPNTVGQGAAGRLQTINAFVTTTSGVTVGSTYRMVRIPTNAKVKHVFWESAAMTQGSFDVGIYYSDSTVDGTTPANQGVIVPTTGSAFFGSAVSAASAVAMTDITNESGNYTVANRNKELWDALALTSDPGGFFDIVFVSTNTITAGALFGVEVQFVM